MRAHHHDFREEEKNYMTTKYQDDYGKYDQTGIQGLNKDQIAKKMLELRYSNIVLGKEQVDS